MHVDPYLSSDIKLNSQWIKDLNRNPENLNFIKETVENNNFEFTDDRKKFLNSIMIAQAPRQTIFDFVNLKNVYMTKDTII